MFTGIVEEMGEVVAVADQGDAVRLTVAASVVLDGTRPGDSVAVDGCCLTVADRTAGSFTADVMQETLDRTSLAGALPGRRVNLERAATLQTRLGGHLVQGHVDGVGVVVRRSPSTHWDLVEVATPPDLSRYLVEKGSVTVDGISLTLVDAGEESFTVGLIPKTLARTTLGHRQPGDPVNLEVDVLAKHIERLLRGRLPVFGATS